MEPHEAFYTILAIWLAAGLLLAFITAIQRARTHDVHRAEDAGEPGRSPARFPEFG